VWGQVTVSTIETGNERSINCCLSETMLSCFNVPYYESKCEYLVHRHPKEALSHICFYFQPIPSNDVHISKMAKTQNFALQLAQYVVQTVAERELNSKGK
jgi:hypothetical protein